MLALAARPSGRPAARLSHVSAALRYWVSRTLAEPFHAPSVTVRRLTSVRGRPVLDDALPRRASPGHVETVRRDAPLPVPARTVVDCMRDLSPGDGLAIADAAVRAGQPPLRPSRDLREFQRRWPGSLRTERILRLGDGSPGSRGSSRSQRAGCHRMGPAALDPPGGRQRLPRTASWVASTASGPSSEWSARPTAAASTWVTSTRHWTGAADAVARAQSSRRRSVRSGCATSGWRSFGGPPTRSPGTRSGQRAMVGRGAHVPTRAASERPLTCSCCRLPVTSCEIGAVFYPSRLLRAAPKSARSRGVRVRWAVRSGRGGSGGRRPRLRRGRHPGR